MIPFNYRPLGDIIMAKDEIIDYGKINDVYYRKWKSGFIEQWGIATLNNTTTGIANCSSPRKFIYPISFTDLNYLLISSWSNSIFRDNVMGCDFGYAIKDLNSFTACIDENLPERTWYACGY